MNPAVTSATGLPAKLWPARSRAEVAFSCGEEDEVMRIARGLFGRRLRPAELAGLAGAPDRAAVNAGTFGHGLYIDVSDPLDACFRLIVVLWRRGLDVITKIVGFHVHVQSMRRKGLGLQIFHRQLQNALALGVTSIEATAGRREDENGYYTWPRFGFDGPLPGTLRRNLPSALDGAQTVLELMRSETGRRWWRDHGQRIDVVFDVADGSRSRRTFDRYVRARLREYPPT